MQGLSKAVTPTRWKRPADLVEPDYDGAALAEYLASLHDRR
jgi:hypothetical protein